MEWLIGLLGGLLGGNAAGAVSKKNSLGVGGNSAVGAAGGAILGGILQAVLNYKGGMNFGEVATQLLGGAGAGGIITSLVGALKNRMGGTGDVGSGGLGRS